MHGLEEREVLSFLRSVDATFERLLDRFVWAGIADRTRLVILARWSVGEIDSFLSREVRLDPFEKKMISDGLRKMLQA